MAEEPQKYGHFQSVFDRIQQLAAAKTFYDTDVENMKEVLSMLEMAELALSPARTEIARFICDVIDAYTPKVKSDDKAANEPLVEWVFGDGYIAQCYGLFVAGLCGLRLEGAPDIKRSYIQPQSSCALHDCLP